MNEGTTSNKFEFTPLMFWEDITYVIQLIADFIKSLFKFD